VPGPARRGGDRSIASVAKAEKLDEMSETNQNPRVRMAWLPVTLLVLLIAIAAAFLLRNHSELRQVDVALEPKRDSAGSPAGAEAVRPTVEAPQFPEPTTPRERIQQFMAHLPKPLPSPFALGPETPPRVRELLTRTNWTWNGPPLADVLEPLTEEDAPVLLRLYKEQSELRNKTQLAWALGMVGGEESARALWATITEDHSRLVGDADEWLAFRAAVHGLGAIASRSDFAYEKLLETASEQYWREHRTLRLEDESKEPGEDLRTAAVSIKALGISGRLELAEWIAGLKEAYEMKDPSVRHTIALAAYYHEFASRQGSRALLLSIRSAETPADYLRWRRRGDGKHWDEWVTGVKTPTR